MIDDVLILKWNLNDIVVPRQKLYKMDTPYRCGNLKIMQAFRLLWKKLHFPFYKKIWYRKIKDKKGTIIIFDAMMEKKLLENIVEDNPEARVVFWYWNKITDKKIQPQEIKKIGCDVWSFNIDDCKKFDLKLNHTYYCEADYQDTKEEKTEKNKYDLMYIGRDKGRMKKIDELMKNPEYKDLTVYRYIVADHFWETLKKSDYKRALPYKKVINMQRKTKAILELVPFKSKGLTLRVMDMMMMEKKLVTDNEYVREMDFYKPENIFILGKENKYDIKTFLDIPFKRIEEDVRNEYSFEAWVRRFVENKPQSGDCYD